MNLVTTINGAAVTTSLAIAEGTQNEHRAVLQLARTYLADLEEFGGVAFEMRPFDTLGGMQKREVAILNEQQSTLLLTYMRNSDIVRQFKKALVRAFWEIAQKAVAPALPDFSNPAAAARAWAEQFEQRQLVEEQKVMLEHKVAEQAPKVAAQDMLARSNGELCLTDAAKALGVPLGKLTTYLIRIGWAYRRQSNNRLVGYTVKEQQGLVAHRPVTIYHKSGDIESLSQLLITPKGLAKLAEMIAMGMSA